MFSTQKEFLARDVWKTFEGGTSSILLIRVPWVKNIVAAVVMMLTSVVDVITFGYRLNDITSTNLECLLLLCNRQIVLCLLGCAHAQYLLPFFPPQIQLLPQPLLTSTQFHAQDELGRFNFAYADNSQVSNVQQIILLYNLIFNGNSSSAKIYF